MDRLCRICLKSEVSEKFALIDSGLEEKIFMLSNVKIEDTINCPAIICAECIRDIYVCYQLCKKIQSSDEYFRSKLVTQVSKADEIEEEFIEEDEIKIEALEYEALEELEEEEIITNEVSDEARTRRGRKLTNIKRTYNRLKCKICGITFSRRQRLFQHERLHFVEGNATFYECDVCGKQFNQRFSIIPHFQKHHNYKRGPIERWKCAICVNNKTLPAGKMEVHYEKFHSLYSASQIQYK
jgi:hypothetical protein